MRMIITSQEQLHKYRTEHDNTQRQDYTPMSGINPFSWASNIKEKIYKKHKKEHAIIKHTI